MPRVMLCPWRGSPHTAAARGGIKQMYPGVERYRSGDTALAAAIRENRVEVIKVLVMRGADVKKKA